MRMAESVMMATTIRLTSATLFLHRRLTPSLKNVVDGRIWTM